MTGPEVAALPFPRHPIRDVVATYVHQTSCPGDFAQVTVDFEPGEAGFAFEVAQGARIPPDPEAAHYVAALEEGLRAELAERVPGCAVAVVLRGIRIHEVDSREGSFRQAGRVAVRVALQRE
ncbi:hypothetical protein GCM10010334_25680 [Streptomyces finlayi]|uniref:Translation elongation factor EFG/EF2 domain-containing protein n=1 Tax=Streptomyces finlayi TaxID=67296 RepID=A0A919C9J5_9ACTN|nr:hypothetical protein [Streptomyces finlayi]GHC91042.1 hypothetical protein GCM10010334_25680 [Streptomyces finlayi]